MESNELKANFGQNKSYNNEEDDIETINCKNFVENKNYFNKRSNYNTSINSNNIQSHKELIQLKQSIKTRDEDEEVKVFNRNYKENDVNNNNSLTPKNNKNEGKRGFFSRNFGWLNYLITEIPLFWKKEELVEGYDANGNKVFRPKKKIPTREKSITDLEKSDVIKESNFTGMDYTKKGMNYGVYFY